MPDSADRLGGIGHQEAGRLELGRRHYIIDPDILALAPRLVHGIVAEALEIADREAGSSQSPGELGGL